MLELGNKKCNIKNDTKTQQIFNIHSTNNINRTNTNHMFDIYVTNIFQTNIYIITFIHFSTIYLYFRLTRMKQIFGKCIFSINVIKIRITFCYLILELNKIKDNIFNKNKCNIFIFVNVRILNSINYDNTIFKTQISTFTFPTLY
jgi:hypothetical protein